MQRNIVISVLSVIVILAAAVRLYNLSTVAPSPYLDEVSNGYNAYSILKTGADEYGRHLPLLLQAYNDFRPAVFVYLTMPFVALFGLTTFAIRLPAVLLHVLATISIYFLTKELLTRDKPGAISRKQKDLYHAPLTAYVPLLASFLYAISPWSIYSSRMSDEINMSLCFFVFGLTCFLYAINRKIQQRKAIAAFFASIALFVIAFYAYHGIKLFTPFFLLGLVLIFYKTLLQRKSILLLGVIFGCILLLPLGIAFTAPGTTVRLGAVNIITQNQNLVSLSSQRILYDKSHHDLVGEVFDNRRLLIGLQVVQNYLRNFDPAWLFLQQGNRTFMVPDFGPLYLFALPLLLLGIYFVIKTESISPNIKLLLFLWIVTSVIPSGISSESPHLNRTNTILPAFTILEAMGLYVLLFWMSRFQNMIARYSGYTIVGVVIAVSFIWFLHAYFVEFPYVHAKEFQYGTIQAFTYAKAHEHEYQKIIVSNGNIFLEGYMYYLFAAKYDPATYQRAGGTHSAFFTDTHLIGKYDFRDPNLYEPKPSGSVQHILYITNPGELSATILKHEQASIIQKYQFPDGTDAVWIWDATI